MLLKSENNNIVMLLFINIQCTIEVIPYWQALLTGIASIANRFIYPVRK